MYTRCVPGARAASSPRQGAFPAAVLFFLRDIQYNQSQNMRTDDAEEERSAVQLYANQAS